MDDQRETIIPGHYRMGIKSGFSMCANSKHLDQLAHIHSLISDILFTNVGY